MDNFVDLFRKIASPLTFYTVVAGAVIGSLVLFYLVENFKSILTPISFPFIFLSILFGLIGLTFSAYYFDKDYLAAFKVYIKLNILAIVILSIVLGIIIKNTNNLTDLIGQLVSSFDISQSIDNSVINFTITKNLSDLFDLSKIIAIVTLFFIYCSVFIYIKNKTIYAVLGDDKESNYILFIYQGLRPVISYILIPCTLLYFLLVHVDLIQVFIIIDAFLFILYFGLPLLNYASIIAHNYSILEKINGPPKSPYRSALNLFVQIAQIMIFVLSLIIIYEMFYFKLNLITIIFVILCIFTWFHIVSVVNAIPAKKVTFTFIDGSKESNVYIIEETKFGDYIVLPMPDILSPQKSFKTLLRSSIIEFEEESIN